MRDPAVGHQGEKKRAILIVQRLLSILSSYALEEVEIRKGKLRCCVRRLSSAPVMGEGEKGISPSPQFVSPPVIPRPEEEPVEELIDVTAPMTGVFYRAPAPGAPPYVEVGDFVEEGQTLCLIEAMKVFNEIPSPVSGEVAEILAQNETLVKQGETLFRIRPSSTKGDEKG